MKKVLIINAYSYKNRGDCGIIISMVDLLRKAYQNEKLQISVMSQFYEENASFYNDFSIKSVPPVWNINLEGRGFLYKYFDGLKKVIRYKKQDLQVVESADIVLSAGGGYLYSSRKGFFGVGFLNCLYHIWLAQKLKKKVMLFPQSVGPLNFFLDKWILKKVFDHVDIFYSREGITTSLAHNINLQCKVKEVPDIAFTLAPLKNDAIVKAAGISADKVNVGITVLDWRFAKSNSEESDIEAYLNKIATSLKTLHAKMENLSVFIFPQVTVSEKDGDTGVSVLLQRKIGEIAKVVSLDNVVNPKELVYLYSQMNAFVGSRMHSAIFALAGHVPTVALAYQPKTIGTFNLAQMDSYALEIQEFSSQELLEKLESVLILKERTSVKAKINELQKFIETEISEDLKTQKI